MCVLGFRVGVTHGRCVGGCVPELKVFFIKMSFVCLFFVCFYVLCVPWLLNIVRFNKYIMASVKCLDTSTAHTCTKALIITYYDDFFITGFLNYLFMS